MKTIQSEDCNIEELRKIYPDGLHFVVGDTHCEYATLKALTEKIGFDAGKDHAYFLGDYNGGGYPGNLLKFISAFYEADYTKPGFHLIRGNHERELGPYFPLENMPDIIVLKMKSMVYYMVHAGMVSSAFDLINEDLAARPDNSVYLYRLSDGCVAYDAPLRQIIWSRRGLYSQRSRWRQWPSQSSLYRNRAVILHGHTPYCFLMGYPSYGDNNLFWQNQHIWFSEDLQSFDIDANIKGRQEFGENWRGIACVCLEVVDETAGRHNDSLSVSALQNAPNAVFAAPYVPSYEDCPIGNPDSLLSTPPDMKTISIHSDGRLSLQ